MNILRKKLTLPVILTIISIIAIAGISYMIYYGVTTYNEDPLFDKKPLTVEAPIKYPLYPWIGCIIPYMISNDFTQDEKNIILESMNIIKEKSGGIQFIEQIEKKGKNYVKIDVATNEDNVCGSVKPAPTEYKYYPGDGTVIYGEEYSLVLSKKCIKHSTVIHELLHLLGFAHEQSRPDRDTYIEVYYQNIQEDTKSQYEKMITRVYNDITKHTKYDINSIMHYTDKLGAINSKYPTFRAKTNDRFISNNELSSTDIKRLELYYKLYK